MKARTLLRVTRQFMVFYVRLKKHTFAQPKDRSEPGPGPGTGTGPALSPKPPLCNKKRVVCFFRSHLGNRN